MRLGLSLVLLVSAFALGCAGKDKKAEAGPMATKTDATATAKDKKADAKANVKAAPAAPTAAGDKVTCETKGDSRILEVRAQDKGCELAYTKGGTENVVASSQNGNAHCTATLEKIKGRLEEAGFACK